MLLRIIPLLFTCVLLSTVRAADDKDGDRWTVYRGNPAMTGVATGRLPDNLQILWQFDTKEAIEGAPAVENGVVYVASFDEYLYAIDLATGKERWKYKGGSFKAAPALHRGKVYVGDQDGLFHCVDAATGTKRWTFPTEGEIPGGANFFNDRILIGSHDETLYCLDDTGKVLWKIKTEGPVNGAPVVSNGKTFVAGCDGKLHVIDANLGKEESNVELAGQAAATASAVGDLLYVGTMTNEVQAVDWKQGKIAWTFRPARRAQPFYGSAAVTDKLVIAGSRDKKVYALDRLTGKEVWSTETGGRIDASPVVVGDRIYIGALDGKLYILDLATGKVLAKIDLGSPVTGSPAAVDGRLLIGTQKGTLYCLGEKK
jgi:outer membrane protein assembly factor BamB